MSWSGWLSLLYSITGIHYWLSVEDSKPKKLVYFHVLDWLGCLSLMYHIQERPMGCDIRIGSRVQ